MCASLDCDETTTREDDGSFERNRRDFRMDILHAETQWCWSEGSLHFTALNNTFLVRGVMPYVLNSVLKTSRTEQG